MDFRFYKALPEPQANVQFPRWPDGDEEPDFVLVALERTNDPDAKNHTGFDFFGAFGDGAAMDQWADEQPVEDVTKEELPSPITLYPTPFNEA
jgi:hypothetical protein